MENQDEYHGIVMDASQKDKSIFERLDVIGRKKVALGAVCVVKLRVKSADLEKTISDLRANMADRFLALFKNFYVHFYRGDEVIAAFKDKVFHMTTNKSTWNEAIVHGRGLGIPERQLDFFPCRIGDETY